MYTFLALAYARPDTNNNFRGRARDLHLGPRWKKQLRRRETPQEHSHQKFITKTRKMLDLDNPHGIVDPIFGLLDNADGSAGQGSITDTDCLQQATADQAFTNAKAAGDVDGMTAALIYRALERNTNKVGLASVPCTAMKAVNPEVAIIKPHQDPASQNAGMINFNIVINLAIQISSVGGDPTLALQSGTFAPGNDDDPTAAGNTCDDRNDAKGCIYTKGLLVEDASVDDIMSAVAAAGVAGLPPTDKSRDGNSSPHTGQSRDGKIAKVLAPVVVACVFIAAVLMWWWFRRRKQKRLRERMEEKVEWLQPEFGETMRAQMTALDSSKTERLDERKQEETAAEAAGTAGVGGKEESFVGRIQSGRDGDKGHRIPRKPVAIEWELQGSEMAGARSPMTFLKDSLNRLGHMSEGDSTEQLTTIPNAKIDGSDKDSDDGSGWKVFKGNRETRVGTWLRGWNRDSLEKR